MPENNVQQLRSNVTRQRPSTNANNPGVLFINFPDKQISVFDATKTVQDLVAVRFFSSTGDYIVGELVVQAGSIYRCTAPHNHAAFNPANFQVLGELFEAPNDANVYARSGLSWVQTILKTTYDAFVSATNSAISLLQGRVGVNEGDITALQADVALRAPINNPSLTGAPRAATPAQASDDDRIATTAWANARLATDLAPKAPLASPTFTGDPKAPTPATADNDTSIATTAFVKLQGYLTDAPSDGLSYGRKNGAWATIVGGAVVSDTAPVTALLNGQLWWESDTGVLYLYYQDGDSNQWVQVGGSQPAASPRQVKVTVVASSTTSFQFDPLTSFAEVEVVGGGGGGGGTSGTPAAGACGGGAGGGAGGVSKKSFAVTSAIRAATKTIVVGAAGAGGVAANGSAGGASSYADTVNSLAANGGGGGNAMPQTTFIGMAFGAAGGTASGGDTNSQGAAGGAALAFGSSAQGTYAATQPGSGASSPYGQGGVGPSQGSTTTPTGANGNTATGNGAGGSGGLANYNASNRNGGAGSAGLVIIREYA